MQPFVKAVFSSLFLVEKILKQEFHAEEIKTFGTRRYYQPCISANCEARRIVLQFGQLFFVQKILYPDIVVHFYFDVSSLYRTLQKRACSLFYQHPLPLRLFKTTTL